MFVEPNCKINLGLYILEKRSDGFHNIETVFYPVYLCDMLEINPENGKTIIQLTGEKIEGDTEQNLCMSAYRLLSADFKLPPVKIHLHKEIPSGAGLGGGSSDGAFSIKALNNIFSLNLSNEKMEEYAGRLGSDCAFFIKNKPVFAGGKGDKFFEICLSLKNYYIVIIKPEININTKEAYSLIKPDNTRKSIKEIINSPITNWKEELKNDFENVIFHKHPKLQMIKDKLYKEGAVYSSMSGSGSAVYGIFTHNPDEADFSDYKFVWKGKLK